MMSIEYVTSLLIHCHLSGLPPQLHRGMTVNCYLISPISTSEGRYPAIHVHLTNPSPTAISLFQSPHLFASSQTWNWERSWFTWGNSQDQSQTSLDLPTWLMWKSWRPELDSRGTVGIKVRPKWTLYSVNLCHAQSLLVVVKEQKLLVASGVSPKARNRCNCEPRHTSCLDWQNGSEYTWLVPYMIDHIALMSR